MKARIAKKVAQRTSYRTQAQRRASRQILERRPKWRPRIWFSIRFRLPQFSIEARSGLAAYGTPIAQIIEQNSLKTVPTDPRHVFQAYLKDQPAKDEKFRCYWCGYWPADLHADCPGCGEHLELVVSKPRTLFGDVHIRALKEIYRQKDQEFFAAVAELTE